VRAACPLCGSGESEPVYDMTGVRAPGAIPGLVARCRACPMWFKVPGDASLVARAYGDDYAAETSDLAYMGGEATRAFFRGVLAGVSIAPRAGRPRLLDVGAGAGALVELAGEMGFDAEGIDLCGPNAARAAGRGLRVRQGDALELDADGVYDTVTIMDLVEHVLDPLRLLRAARRALAPGGQLVVYTPNHRAAVVLFARLLARLGVRYPAEEIFGRNHVCFFDDRTLAAALERSGLALERLVLSPYDPRRPGAPISPLHLAAVTALERLGQPFRRVFRLLAYARRPAGAG
jgi:2-polyprenyl-3-methyl-5-hydroxy-6-metoxy-1,4-benzoquinol methylase